MARIHILAKDIENKTVDCIFHISVPNANNAVGTNWRTAVTRGLNPTPSMAWNGATENDQVSAGEVLEVHETVRFSITGLNNAQRLAEVEAAYTARSTILLTELAAKLDFFGLEVI